MENKVGNKRFLVALTAFLCVIIIALLAFELRLTVGWKPFPDVTGENLYYVCYQSWSDKNIHLLDEEKQEELADILREMRVRTIGLWIEVTEYPRESSSCPFLFDEIYGGSMKWSLTVEQTEPEREISEIRLLQLFEYKDSNSESIRNERKDRYGLMINGQQYFISKRSYQRLEQFVDSLPY